MTLRRKGIIDDDGPSKLPALPPGTKPGKRPGHAYAVQLAARRRGHKVLTVAPNLRVRNMRRYQSDTSASRMRMVWETAKSALYAV